MKLKFWKTAIFAKNRSFSFIKWKPLIQETWFLSHSLGNFIEWTFCVIKLLDIPHFPDRLWSESSKVSWKMPDIYKSKSFIKKGGPSKRSSQQNFLENEIEIKFIGLVVFILWKKNCNFLLLQKSQFFFHKMKTTYSRNLIRISFSRKFCWLERLLGSLFC